MPWPFSRRRSETPAAGRAAEPTRAPAPAPVQRAAEWATLPPIQRSVSPIELTAETGLFLDNLTTHTPVETALQPLGHDVTMEAPAGIASGIARPVEHVGSTTQLQHRLKPAPAAKPARAQRAPVAAAPAAPPAPLPVLAVSRAEDEAPPAEEEEAAASPAEEAVAQSPAAEAPPAELPVQRAPADAPKISPAPSPSAGTSPVARHETGEPHEDEVATSPVGQSPAAPVQRAAEDEEAPEESTEEAATSPESGMQRAPEEPTAPTVGARPVVAPNVFRSSIGPVPVTVGLERTEPLPYAAQRAPAESAAATPVAREEAAPAAAPVAGAAEPVQRAAEQAESGIGPAPDLPLASAQRAPETPATPETSVQRAAEGAPPAAPADMPPVQRAPETASGPAASPPSPARPAGRVGLGAPFRPLESPAARGSFHPEPGVPPMAGPGPQRSPQPGPQPGSPPAPEQVFRRTRSSLTAPGVQRAPEGAAPTPSAAPGPAPAAPPASQSTPASAPLAGSTPLGAEPPAPTGPGAQRAPAAGLGAPLPPAQAPIAPGAQRAPAGAQPPLEFAVQRAEDEGPASAAPQAPGPAAAGPPAAPEAPPASGFDAFVARALSMSAETATAGGEDAVVQRAAEGSVSAELLPAPGQPVQLAPRLDLPRRKRGGGTSPASASAPSSEAVPAAGVQRAAEAAAKLAALPVVGKRPIQRSSDEVPAPVKAHVEQQVSASLGDVKVHRSPESGSTARQLKARAFTTGGEIHLPSEHGPLDREPAKSLVAHELVHVAQQRQLGPSLPTEDSHHGRELETQAQRVEVATQRSESPLVLARKPDSAAAAEAAVHRVVQRAQSAGQGSAARQLAPQQTMYALQRAVEINEVTTSVGAGGGASAPAAAAPAAPAAPAAGGGGGDARGSQPDPLTGMPPHAAAGSPGGAPLGLPQLEQAWSYVRSRMGEELLTDRDRAGFSIDLF